ncbi:MAG: hypothetical protein JSR91_19445 [Proteobacteria bacterium]|nr:hypothetical protein [Pseudomonadota bacterium]
MPRIPVDYARLHDFTILPIPEGTYISQLDAKWCAEAAIFNWRHLVSSCFTPRKGVEPGTFDNLMVA